MMTRVYYRVGSEYCALMMIIQDSNVAAVVFDLSEQRSFDAVPKWKEDLDQKVCIGSKKRF